MKDEHGVNRYKEKDQLYRLDKKFSGYYRQLSELEKKQKRERGQEDDLDKKSFDSDQVKEEKEASNGLGRNKKDMKND